MTSSQELKPWELVCLEQGSSGKNDTWIHPQTKFGIHVGEDMILKEFYIGEPKEEEYTHFDMLQQEMFVVNGNSTDNFAVFGGAGDKLFSKKIGDKSTQVEDYLTVEGAEQIKEIQFSPDSKCLAIAASLKLPQVFLDKEPVAFDCESNPDKLELSLTSLTWTTGGHFLLGTSTEGQIYIFEVNRQAKSFRLCANTKVPRVTDPANYGVHLDNIAVDANGSVYVAGDKSLSFASGVFQITENSAEETLHSDKFTFERSRWVFHDAPIYLVKLVKVTDSTGSEELMISVSTDGLVKVWNLTTKQMVYEASLPGTGTDCEEPPIITRVRNVGINQILLSDNKGFLLIMKWPQDVAQCRIPWETRLAVVQDAEEEAAKLAEKQQEQDQEQEKQIAEKETDKSELPQKSKIFAEDDEEHDKEDKGDIVSLDEEDLKNGKKRSKKHKKPKDKPRPPEIIEVASFIPERKPPEREKKETINVAEKRDSVANFLRQEPSTKQNQAATTTTAPFCCGASLATTGTTFLCWSIFGKVIRRPGPPDPGVVDIEYTTGGLEKITIPNHHRFSGAAINYNGVVMAPLCPDHTRTFSKPGTIYFKASKGASEWNVDLDKGESVQSLTLGEFWLAVGTTRNYLRFFSLGGSEFFMLGIPGDLITLAAYENILAVFFKAGTSIKVLILNVSSQQKVMSSAISVTKNSEIRWAGFSKQGALSYQDTSFVLWTLASPGVCVPVLDPSYSGITQKTWVVGVSDTTAFGVHLEPGENEPSPLRGKTLQSVPLKIPLTQPNFGQFAMWTVQRDQKLLRSSIWGHINPILDEEEEPEEDDLHAFCRMGIPTSEELDTESLNQDKAKVNSLREAGLEDRTDDALLTSVLIESSRVLPICSKLLDKMGKKTLSKKVNSLAQRFGKFNYVAQSLPATAVGQKIAKLEASQLLLTASVESLKETALPTVANQEYGEKVLVQVKMLETEFDKLKERVKTSIRDLKEEVNHGKQQDKLKGVVSQLNELKDRQPKDSEPDKPKREKQHIKSQQDQANVQDSKLDQNVFMSSTTTKLSASHQIEDRPANTGPVGEVQGKGADPEDELVLKRRKPANADHDHRRDSPVTSPKREPGRPRKEPGEAKQKKETVRADTGGYAKLGKRSPSPEKKKTQNIKDMFFNLQQVEQYRPS